MKSESNGCPARGLSVTLTVSAIVAVLFALLCGYRLVGATAGAAPVPIADAKSAQTHLFRFVPPAGKPVSHVYLAGDFNGWSTDATPMTAAGDGYEATVTLSEGVHYYKFVVDGHWLNDPQSQSELEVSDDNGGKNSAVLIGFDARKLPAPVANQIDAAAIAFEPSDVRDCNVVSDSMIRFSIRAQANDVVDASVLMQTSTGWMESPLAKTETDRGFDRFGGVLTPAAPAGAILHYVFKLSKPGASVFVADSKAFSDAASAEAKPYETVLHTDFETPDWAQHAVWYQIFPERFRNGDPSNDPPNTLKWTGKWFGKQPGETGQFYRDVWSRRYGGDIQGVQQGLPYLRSLGINAIYLNPIFQAWDMHKYDTTDYRHVDEHFGVAGDIEKLQGETEDPTTWKWTASDKVFLEFLAEAHRQGFRVIIDGVFNHVGTRFWAFQDVIKNGKNSKYADWFDITDWNPSENAPFHYHAWDKDNGALPALKKDAQLGIAHGPREHILAITRRWLAPDGDASKGVDGFRLDAPEGIAHPFWSDFRKLVKSIKPDAYIDGEIWGQAQSWLHGDEYDAVMNYQFAMASQAFFVNEKKAISVSELNSRANQLVFNYPFQAALVNQNLFDSHDTDRVASMFVNPDLPFDGANRIQDNGPRYNPAKPNAQQRQRMLQEVAWQMTFVGAPMIYYGDETGMWSPDDPSDRQPMVWKDLQPYDDPEVKFDQEKFDWYQRLIAVRNRFPALQRGFFRPVKIDDVHGIYAYARDLGRQHVYVVLNHTNRAQTIDFKPSEPSAFLNWLDPMETLVTPPADARPGIVAIEHNVAVPLNDKTVPVKLQAWGAAIFAPAR